MTSFIMDAEAENPAQPSEATENDRMLRQRAVELAARFALIGEDALISIARAELIYDFLLTRGTVKHVDLTNLPF